MLFRSEWDEKGQNTPDGMSFKIVSVDGSELSNQVITYDDMVKYLYGE